MREHVDLPMLEALEAEWAQWPPVHHLVAAYLDYKPPAVRESETDQALLELMGSLPQRPGAAQLDDGAWRQHLEGTDHG